MHRKLMARTALAGHTQATPFAGRYLPAVRRPATVPRGAPEPFEALGTVLNRSACAARGILNGTSHATGPAVITRVTRRGCGCLGS